MNVIIRFLRTHLHFVVFLFFQVLAFVQLYQFRQYQQSSLLHTGNLVSGKFFEVKNGISQYFGLRYENEILARENLELRKMLDQSHVVLDLKKRVSTDTQVRQRYEYLLAQVINSTTTKINNFITINKGRAEGVRPKMGVICPSGVVGIVFEVGEHYSVVMSMLNSQFRVSPEIPSANFREGSVSWNGLNAELVQVNGISKFLELKKGMHVFTSGYSANFPAGIPIGEIYTVTTPKDGSFFEVQVKLSTRFDNLNTVYLVSDIIRTQIDTLEQTTIMP